MSVSVPVRWASGLVLAAAHSLLGSGLALAGAPALGPLHVPSPDWRDQVIYFAMTDRFDDGDARNNDQGAGEFDPNRGSHYSGGDLKGVFRRLDYIRGLGATALWLTPVVANRWWDGTAQYTGFHGYWAENFMQVDKHLGTLADYQQLSRALHGRGMYLVHDIVLNHMGDYFHYAGGHDPAHPERFYKPSPGKGGAAPTQWPFSLNDPRRSVDRRLGVYHWTPDVADYTQRQQELNFQMAGLDDLNTESPLVRRALRQSHGFWITHAGVDAFRLDTAFYVPQEAMQDFMFAKAGPHPGVAEVARRTGRKDFLVFGEGFGIDKAMDDRQAKKVESYMHTPEGKPVLPGMLNFGLYGSAQEVFARGAPTGVLAHRIDSMMALHPRVHWMPSFLDNHDVDRFLAGGSEAGLKQNLLMLMTLPGIPVIYYGTEQGFTEQRASMFKAGWGSGGKDRFDTGAPLYRFIQEVVAVRRADKVFSRGKPTVLRSNAAGAGVLAYRMDHEGRSAWVLFNTADHEVLVDGLQTGAAPGAAWQSAYLVGTLPSRVRHDAQGRVTMAMPPRSAGVWRLAEGAVPPAVTGSQLAPTITLEAQEAKPRTGDFVVQGQMSTASAAAARLKLVVDDDLSAAWPIAVGAKGQWQATVSTARMVDAHTPHRVVAYDEASGVASDAMTFQVQREWALLADVPRPAGDDRGPQGRYTYATDASWGANRQLDVQRVRVWGSGGAMKLELQMNQLTRGWAPPNGFDHVAFTIFIQLPDQAGGATVMPLQNAVLPEGMRWHRRVRAHGWTNVLFSAEGASASQEGATLGMSPSIQTQAADRTVTFTFSAAALGGLSTLRGAKVYVSTWDYDAGFRALQPLAGAYQFGGGDGRVDPLVMDDSGVISLP